MNVKEARSIVDLIRDAKNNELVIVSLPVLPMLLGAWSVFLNSLAFLDRHEDWKFYIICGLAVLYVFGIFLMKAGDSKEERLKRARYHVESRLSKRPGHSASFQAIRNEVNETYSDDFLQELIELNPELFGKYTIKKVNKPGIQMKIEVVEAAEDIAAEMVGQA